MARLLLSSGDHDRALAHAERAYQLNPCHSDMVSSYGVALVWCGHACEGLEHLERAFAINPYAPAIYKSYLLLAYFCATIHSILRAYWRGFPLGIRKTRALLGDTLIRAGLGE